MSLLENHRFFSQEAKTCFLILAKSNYYAVKKNVKKNLDACKPIIEENLLV